jgi:hypothetical protein
MNALRLQKDNTKLAGLLEEALDCIDQYDYEEAFDLVQRIKDALNHSRMSHPPVVPWGGSSLTEMEELLQKTQQLQRDNAELRQQLEDVQRVRDSIEGALADAYDEAEACWVNKARLADAAEEVLDSYILTKRVLTGHPCPQNMGICIDLRAAIDAARTKEYKL